MLGCYMMTLAELREVGGQVDTPRSRRCFSTLLEKKLYDLEKKDTILIHMIRVTQATSHGHGQCRGDHQQKDEMKPHQFSHQGVIRSTHQNFLKQAILRKICNITANQQHTKHSDYGAEGDHFCVERTDVTKRTNVHSLKKKNLERK